MSNLMSESNATAIGPQVLLICKMTLMCTKDRRRKADEEEGMKQRIYIYIFQKEKKTNPHIHACIHVCIETDSCMHTGRHTYMFNFQAAA